MYCMNDNKFAVADFHEFGVNKIAGHWLREFSINAAHFTEKGGDISCRVRKEELKKTVRTYSKKKHVQKLELLTVAQTTKTL